MTKLFVWVTGFFFVFYGVAFALFPSEMATLVTGGHPATSSGMIDLRATYGGMSVAVGITILISGVHDESNSFSLLVAAIALLAMAAGRVLGMVLDGEPNVLMYVYLAAEVLFGLGAILLRKNTVGSGDP